MESNADEFMREQRQINQDLRAMTAELKAGHAEHAEILKSLRSLMASHAEEMRDIKVMLKRQQRFSEDHERTLRLHYRLIRGR